MAKCVYGPLVSAVSGSIGGTVFSHSANSDCIRIKSIPVDPKSSSQSAERVTTAYLSQFYRSLSAADKQSWADLALLYPLVNSLNKTYYLSGFCMYMRLNRFYWLMNASTIVTPPSIADNYFPNIVGTTIVMNHTNPASTNIITFPINLDTTLYFQIQCSGVISSGLKFFNKYKTITLQIGEGNTVWYFDADYLKVFNSEPRYKDYILFRVRLIKYDSGFISPWLKLTVIVGF